MGGMKAFNAVYHHRRWLADFGIGQLAAIALLAALFMSAPAKFVLAGDGTGGTVGGSANGSGAGNGENGGIGVKPAQPGAGHDGDDKARGGRSKDRDLGRDQGPGCPYRSRQLELIV